ncbi:MAG: DUF4349 domain-containing protein [Firmicutes bacterium]|nr:DUF4349 domain-containing protein [Bacillota bacterium]
MVKSVCFLVFILFLALVAGCASSGSMDAVDAVAEFPAAAPEVGRDMAVSGYSMASSANQIASEETEMRGNIPGETAAGGRRYLAQRSSLTLEIADLEETAESIRAGVEQMGGYVASLNFYDLTRERRRGQISLRVPEGKYTQAMLWLQEQGEVKSIEESAEDVTMQYIDLEARIANLQAQEQRIRELLEKATDIEDILQIEKELTRIRGDLESMQGEFKYLRERVTFSSIDVYLEEEDPRESAVVDEFSTFGEELAKRFSLNTNRVLKGVTGLLLFLLSSLPLLVPLIILGFILWRTSIYFKRKKKSREEEKKSAAP